MVTQTIRFASSKIKTLQRKAPKKPRWYKSDQNRTLYGYRATYSPRSKSFQQGKRRYVKKGLYSKPGSPPFYHRPGESNPFLTMRKVGEFDQKGYAQQWRPLFNSGRNRGKVVNSKVTGPAVRKNRRGGKPVPILHEEGGTVRLGRGRGLTYQARNGADIIRQNVGVAKYPKRPFVKPGSRAGSLEAWKKYSRKKLTRIGGMRPKKVVKFKAA